MNEKKPLPKSEWGDGPWQTEPDRVDWVYKGVPCLIMRHMDVSGSLNGYIAVLPGHPWHGRVKDYIDMDSNVHGGITWVSKPRGDWLFLPAVRQQEDQTFRDLLLHDPWDTTTRLVYADWLREHDREEEELLLRRNDEMWWIGFDTGHAWDYQPLLIAEMRRRGHLFTLLDHETYRDLAYVTKEVENLADQSLEIKIRRKSKLP